jgi:hypothetical protein
MSGQTRRERITAVLAEHPEGLSTPQIGELVEGDRRCRRMATWEVLRRMEQAGEVTRRPSLGAVVVWRLVPEQERKLYRARLKCIAGWDALLPDDRPCSEAAFREFLDAHDPALRDAQGDRQ